MRPFTIKQFTDAGHQIPNLHPSIKMEQDRERTWSDSYIDTYTFYVKGSYLTEREGQTFAIHDDEWYPLVKLKPGYNQISQAWAEVAVAAGLIKTRNHYDADHAILDSIYYLSNPPVTHTTNGKLRKGIWTTLKRRTNVTAWTPSIVTINLLDLAINEVATKLNTVDVVQINFALRNDHQIKTFICHVTNKIYPEYFARRLRFGSGVQLIGWGINPEDHGYRVHHPDRGSEVYLRENEVWFRDRVYNRDTLVMGTCPVCSREYPEEGITDGACHECNAQRYQIHSYSTRVPTLLSFKAKNVKPNTIYLGIELEYEAHDRDAARIKVGKQLEGHAIMKSDGSIRNGFEIVTCPATLEIHMEEFKKFYDNFPTELFPDTNTGMHVHVSRKPLNQFTIGKMTEFLNREDNKNFIQYIAGRIDNSYAKIQGRTVTYPITTGRGDRYNALNLNPDATIEFRIFSTPKDWQEFASRLEFCQALVDYCQPAQVSGPLKQLTGYPSFINWLQHNRKAYPELSNHLKGFV